MAKFEKFDSRKQIRGLAEAARQIQFEELIRGGKMPSLEELCAAALEARKPPAAIVFVGVIHRIFLPGARGRVHCLVLPSSPTGFSGRPVKGVLSYHLK